MRIKETNVYHYDELSDTAKEKAREWYRDGALYYDWWYFVYEDAEQQANELGIELAQKPIKQMNGKTRYNPEIYFTGFYHQGSGCSFAGRWRAQDLQVDTLKKNCPTDTELHRIADVLADCAKEDGEMWADITAKGDNWISVEVNDGETIEEQLNELEYKSPEYNTLSAKCDQRADEVMQALRDFNHWIFQCLEKEYEWLTSDEQVEASIVANEYEFTEDGKIA